MIDDLILLLVGMLMLLIDDDQPEPRKGKEQGRAGADDNPRLTLCDLTLLV